MAATPQRTDLHIKEFHTLLLRERARLTGVLDEEKSEELGEARSEGEDNLARSATFAAEDNADGGSTLQDEERSELQQENVEAILRDIEHALERIEEGTYGISEISGKPIPVARLHAIPWATMTVEEAENLNP
jgi:RNA polymerase-binding transcription factor DksA